MVERPEPDKLQVKQWPFGRILMAEGDAHSLQINETGSIRLRHDDPDEFRT